MEDGAEEKAVSPSSILHPQSSLGATAPSSIIHSRLKERGVLRVLAV
jgi:hypothetical protein